MTGSARSPILGSLLGTAVGDALGLPYEGMSRERVGKFIGHPLHHRFILGRGMLSDDTEHTLMLTAALIENRDDAAGFQRALGKRLRWWLAGLPAAVGLGTARAILCLWMGVPASKSGVLSAGNGAAMRSAILGVAFRDDAFKRREFSRAACHVTHRDLRAEESCRLVTEAAALAAKSLPTSKVLAALEALLVSEEMRHRFAQLQTALEEKRPVSAYAEEIGCGLGVSGFAPDTVAVALYAWLRCRGRFDTAVRSVIECGGDTDTVAAITGGIIGSEVGEAGIPREWIDCLYDYPRSVHYIRRMARSLEGHATKAPRVPWPLVLLRNFLFLVLVLGHGLRRLLPPY